MIIQYIIEIRNQKDIEDQENLDLKKADQIKEKQENSIGDIKMNEELIEEISNTEYLYRLSKKDTKYIVPNTDGVAYKLKDNSAYCRVVEDKKVRNAIWIHGLFSFKSGSGAKLLQIILDNNRGKTIRLNCIGKKLKNYYSQFGFKKYVKLVSVIECKPYYEMVNKDQPKHRCPRCNTTLAYSDNHTYSFQCFICEVDYFSFEVV